MVLYLYATTTLTVQVNERNDQQDGIIDETVHATSSALLKKQAFPVYRRSFNHDGEPIIQHTTADVAPNATTNVETTVTPSLRDNIEVFRPTQNIFWVWFSESSKLVAGEQIINYDEHDVEILNVANEIWRPGAKFCCKLSTLYQSWILCVNHSFSTIRGICMQALSVPSISTLSRISVASRIQARRRCNHETY